MAIYKDYGTPPAYNTTQHTAGTSGNQRGNYTMLGAPGTSQYRGGTEALPALAVRQAESITQFTTAASEVLNLGDLDVVKRWVDARNGLATTMEIVDETSGEVLTVVWTGSALTADESGTNSVLKLNADSVTPASEVLVNIDASNNLTITAGASTGDRTYTVKRFSDFELALEFYEALRAEGDDPGAPLISSLFDKYGLGGFPLIGASWDDYPTGPVGGAFLGWLFSTYGISAALSYSAVITEPVDFNIGGRSYADVPIEIAVGRSSTVTIGEVGSGSSRSVTIGTLLGVALAGWGQDAAEVHEELVKTALLVPTNWDTFAQIGCNASDGDNCFQGSTTDPIGDGPEAENCKGIPFGWAAQWNDDWVQLSVTGGWVGSATVADCSGGGDADGCCTDCIWTDTDFGFTTGSTESWVVAADEGV